VPRVIFSEVFAHENVPQMCSTVGALNLRSDAIGVWKPTNRARNLLIEAGPPAIRLKFAFAAVKRRTATFADVGAFLPKREVFACEGSFGAFPDDDTLLLRSKLSTLILRSRHKKTQSKLYISQVKRLLQANVADKQI